MKKILKILIIPLLIIMICILSLSYTITENNNYKDRLLKRVTNHYKIDNITYINYQNNYYILTTKDYVIVLDNEYKEILKEKISILQNNDNNYELIYKTNKLMYEKTTLTKNKVTYTYYDAQTGKEIGKTTMEK